MCENNYINLQTGELLDLKKVSTLPDNAMLKVRPDLWEQWDFKKNDELGFDVWKITFGSNKEVNWKCNLNHQTCASIQSRMKSKLRGGCPICSGKSVLIGFNDMWTTNPTQAKLLANHEDGYKYTQCSEKLVDWKCSCGEIIKNKRIADIKRRGLKCPKCSDGLKYPEKFMYTLLSNIGVDFKLGFTKKWTVGKRYDFFIPSLNCIIETHGGQHYNGGFENLGGKSLKEEQENDKYKRELALNNGINHYIELDCRESDMDYIRNSIINSELDNLFDLSGIDWNEIALKSEKSLVIEICNFYNNINKDISKISKEYNLCAPTIRKYLKKGCKMGLCDYNKETSFKLRGNKLKRRIVQINETLSTIKEYDSLIEASKYITFDKTGISKCLRGIQHTAGGYKWMYIEDYNKYIEESKR